MQRHWHVDVMNRATFVEWTSPPIGAKGAAKRAFEAKVAELSAQVGKFHIRKATDADRRSFAPGAIKIAENHRLFVILSVCDCDTRGGE